jgi:hypothetical protein
MRSARCPHIGVIKQLTRAQQTTVEDWTRPARVGEAERTQLIDLALNKEPRR